MNKKGLYIFLFLLILISCSKNPPVINDFYWQINVRQDVETQTRYHQLLLFANVTDPDGIENIETLFLFKDNSEIYWEINESTWEKVTDKEAVWLGSSAILLPDKDDLFNGSYRLQIRDLGGESIETSFVINQAVIRPLFPDIKVEDNKLTINGTAASYPIMIYNLNNQFLKQIIINNQQTIDIKRDIEIKNSIHEPFQFDVYQFDTNQGIGFITGPFYNKL